MEICLIFNYVLDFIYSQHIFTYIHSSLHNRRMSTWNQTILAPGKRLTSAITVHGKGVPLSN